MNKKLALLSLIAFTSIASAVHAKEPEVVYSKTPVFSQIVGFGFPINFVEGHQQATTKQYILELIPKGESVQKWTQMITLTGTKDVASRITPKDYLGGIASGFKKSCPSTFSAASIGEFKVSGYPAFAAIVSCGSNKDIPEAETALIYTVVGKEDAYTFQWAEHIPGGKTFEDSEENAKKWKARINTLNPLLLCDKVAGEKAPYPSCIK